jgi:predicted neuraminidase
MPAGAPGPDRRDPLVLALVLVGACAGLLKARDHPAPASFRTREVAAPRGEEPRFQSRFVTTAKGVLTHAACLVELADGRVRAFWYSGSREGAPDVEVRTAVFDPGRGAWGREATVASPGTTGRALLRYVRKVGNPAAIRTPDGTLWLFYVTVSVGGWGGASIAAITSPDEGETWGPARRLISSPLLNVGTMVRGEPFLYADGSIGLPAYQNLLGSVAELLRVDRSGAVVDRQALSAPGVGLQPVILVRSRNEALALMRHSGPEGPQRVIATRTRDAGRHWTPPERLSLSNPDAALSGIVLADGRVLVALNDVEGERDAVSLVASDDGGVTWRTLRILEDQRAARNEPVDDARYDRTVAALARATDARVEDARPYVESSRRFMCWEPRCHFEFSYPYLLQTRRGEFHLVYTWNRSFIKHVQFDQAWLDERRPDGQRAPAD